MSAFASSKWAGVVARDGPRRITNLPLSSETMRREGYELAGFETHCADTAE